MAVDGLKGAPRKKFCYLPLIPRIKLWFTDPSRSKVLQQYPELLSSETFDGWRDCWDGQLYKSHMDRVRSAGNSRHLVFTFATDGVQIVKQKTHGIWPMLLVCANLPPEV